jgi:hypothetical protein
MLILAGLVAGVLGALAVAAEPCIDNKCNSNWWDTDTGSGCITGLDTACCGDMTPLALCPGGQFYFMANLIAFQRSAAQDELFQTRNVNILTSQEVFDADGNSLTPRVFTLESSITKDPVLGTKDLDFQNSAGYKLLMGWKLAECYAIEFSYFDLNDWDETGVVSDNTIYDVDGTIDPVTGLVTVTDWEDFSLFSPFSGFGEPPIDEYDFNDLASIRYRSSLDNVELNVRHWIKKDPSRLAVSVLWGGRYNAIRERFNYFTSSSVPLAGTNNAVDIRTQNDLWGAQVGAQFDFCWDPGWHTEFEIKGGVAHNRAMQESTYDIQDAGAPYWTRVDKDVTSWIGEMRLTLVYQFGTHLTTHIGYEALVLADVALASRNFETDMSILANGPWVLNNGGSVVYHGPSAGLTFAW